MRYKEKIRFVSITFVKQIRIFQIKNSFNTAKTLNVVLRVQKSDEMPLTKVDELKLNEIL